MVRQTRTSICADGADDWRRGGFYASFLGMAAPGAHPHLSPSLMGEELARYEFEILSDDGSLALHRGRSRDRQASILLRCPAGNSFTTTDHEKLSREYSLADEFGEAWAARPRALGEWKGRPALVMNDPGGLPASSIQRQSLDLQRFLGVHRT
jgi:hypothetical protein